MVKSGHKRKKVEKTKVQLKASNKGNKKSLRLQKGHNLTNSQVKTKQIVLLNQLNRPQEDVNQQFMTRKRLGIKDLLAKVGNQSTSTRLEGLKGIEELLTMTTLTTGNDDHHQFNLILTVLISRLAPLISDRESRVRRLGSALLKAVLLKAKEGKVKMEAQFPVLSAHLCCGLTSIVEDIQRESLDLLDAVMESLPDLVSSNFDALLPRCADQISKVKGDGGPAGRTLTVSPTDKVAALQRRFEVVDRVRKMLKVLSTSSLYGRKPSFHCLEGPARIRARFPDDKSTFLFTGLYFCPEKDDCLMTSDLVEYAEGQMIPGTSGHNSPRRTLLTGLIPVLLQTWQETATPTTNNKTTTSGSSIRRFQSSSGSSSSSMTGTTVVSYDALKVLEAVCDVIDLIVSWLESDQGGVSGPEGDIFSSGLLFARFPFEMSGKVLLGPPGGPEGGRLSGKKAQGGLAGEKKIGASDPDLADLVNLSVVSLCLRNKVILKTKGCGNPDSTASIIFIMDYLEGLLEGTPEWGRLKADKMAEVLRLLASRNLQDKYEEEEKEKLVRLLERFSERLGRSGTSYRDLMSGLIMDQTFCGAKLLLQEFVQSLPLMALRGDINPKGLQTLQELLRRRDPRLMEALAKMDGSEFEEGLLAHLQDKKWPPNPPPQRMKKLTNMEICKTLAFMSPHIIKPTACAAEAFAAIKTFSDLSDERSYINSVLRNLCQSPPCS